ncbi:hypothetical protein B7463_g786, partial [Scytalidium lignicola]
MVRRSADSVVKTNRHASRASLACTRCKRAKRRCDISQTPAGVQSCSSCRLKNEECEIRIEDDKRRGKQRGKTERLQSRIAALEDLIRRNLASDDVESWLATNNNQLDSSYESSEYRLAADQVEEPESRRAQPMQHDAAISPQQGPPGVIAMQNSILSPIISTVPLGTPKQSWAAASISPGSDPTTNAAPEAVFGPLKTPSTVSDGSSTVMDEVTARAGELKGRDGKKMQYFGATSMFYHGVQDGAPQLSAESVDDITSRQLSRAAIRADAEPEPIVMHLLDLFFDWQASHLNVVDRDAFMLHRRLDEENPDYDDRTFYSPALLYAIISLASLISPDRGVRRYSSSNGGTPGDLFLRKARALLDMEIGNSTTTTAQAALLVGSWYGAVGHTSLGWTYSGASFRMCYELGLHMNCSRAVAHGQMSPEVAENRKRIFWGCYMQDKLWSAYCGRPSFFMDWDISVDAPEGRFSGATQLSDSDILTKLRQGMVYLSKRCSETLLSLYSQRHNSKPDGLLRVATRIHEDLYKWHEQLPVELDWPRRDGKGPPSPGILALHMQFYFVLILIHRPLLHMSAAQQAIANSDRGTIDSATVCTLAATNIAKLVRDYQQFYCLKRISSPAVHFTFIAATIHIVNFRLFKEERCQFLLHGCLAALTEMGESYPIGRKAVCVLQDLMERWKPQSEPLRHEKNTLQSLDDDDDVVERFGSKYNFTSSLENRRVAVDAERFQQKLVFIICVPRVRKRLTCIDRTTDRSKSEPHSAVQNFEPFDWSEYNSPIELPPLFDTSMIPIPDAESQGIETGPSAELRNVVMCPEQSAFGQYQGASFTINDVEFDLGLPLNDATLSSFYGTSFALMNGLPPL